MKILLIHGPNLNLLGERDKNHYGEITLAELEEQVKTWSTAEILTFQSNHEGELIDFIQQNPADGIIINPGALAHYSYALHDALLDAKISCVEVHLSDTENREDWRKSSVTAAACLAKISGKGTEGYKEALNLLVDAN
ncbi:3-dehydroquinate dehydratase [Candidatus Peregrinibacteria bacterium]|jgi:3-dehydroquinate dehydratase II|nr:3-dehydroquinate dehydratase [Candidatus Peregrinibacteria bacterium]MBT4631477.1 3-dehydroquinate dehydratase [Candidatus Peregrinibacteria bacterium]MBT5516583.1 3-dehydroquinate dehydratase [Candidatus Peregrinibacteria bacterium]MBT5823866.1 3-dehydroquinate dehydratase [Candidatus Peregrinibacteria bacterium]